MECTIIEERLSEYLERSLPYADMMPVAEHLEECRRCSALLEEMRSMLVSCQAFPAFDVDPAFLDRILMRTSGRPRTRTLRERLRAFLFQPMLTPRFAAGMGLALLFVALLASMMAPRAGALAAALSPGELFRQLDRGVQHIYSEGLKMYDTKNGLQEQFTFYKNSLFNKLGIMIEQLDVPVEGQKKTTEPKPQEKTPKQKSSVMLLPA